ncbi:uncharacterized protein LOC111439548 [Cucurbita moschata]|uniref:Uncharacterized protein LOC111439548 n=1 Tax=Cucurbita moschata TaxID=3662 RepID=A0A6J1EXR1_CUCMO|nr:uncharacterized protein LOC111439548 [Cucurbita moschata]
MQRGKVYKLKKALYGLKQAPRAWYIRIHSHFEKMGFTKCPYEYTLYVKTDKGGNIIIICLYVDDLTFTGNNEEMFEFFKKSMTKEFEMTDLGLMRYFLGVEVTQTPAGNLICQKKYAQELLEIFKLDERTFGTPSKLGLKLHRDIEGREVDNRYFKQIVGSLIYLTSTRPDIMYAVSMISRYMEHPTEKHHNAARRILRYVRGTFDLGVFYKKEDDLKMVGYTDSDYAGDIDDRKSTSGSIFMMSSGAICWSSKKQPAVTLSTTEAEFVAAATCSCQAIWLRKMLEILNQKQPGVSTPMFDLCKEGIIELNFCRSDEQIADLFTKPLKQPLFEKLRRKMGMCRIQDVYQEDERKPSTDFCIIQFSGC